MISSVIEYPDLFDLCVCESIVAGIVKVAKARTLVQRMPFTARYQSIWTII